MRQVGLALVRLTVALLGLCEALIQWVTHVIQWITPPTRAGRVKAQVRHSPPPTKRVSDPKRDAVESGLLHCGFKKGEVQAYLARPGIVWDKSVQELLKEGLAALSN